MPYTTVVAGTTITAAWANTNVRDQVITPFASAAARTSAITAPVEGMYAHLNDTNLLTHYNGSVWAPANNNIVARQTLTTNSPVFNADGVTDMTLSSVVVLATRLYEVTARFAYIRSAASTYALDFWVDGVVTDRFCLTDSDREFISCSLLWEPTSGTKTLEVRIDQIVAGGTITLAGASNEKRNFFVKDIGPR